MAGTSRLGMLLLLAACGGGDRAGRTDTTGTATLPPAEQPTTGAADTSMAGGASDTSMAPAASSAADSASTRTGTTDTTKKPRSATTPKPSASAAAGTQDTGKKAAAGAQDTGKKAAAAAANPAGGGPMSPQLIALGDSIFHGQVGGGTCTACHGQDAKGTAVAPDLTDNQWINGDGSYQFIVNTVTNGVPKPKQHPAPMPPKGGAPLNDDQVKAVAAYVYSLSHKT
jgi:mono/diheme cytochrome c family protein